MTDKRFTVIDREEPRKQSVAEDGIPCTARHCCTRLNRLTEENEQLKLELDTHKHPLWSTREAKRKINELTNLLSNETKKNAILLEEINSLRIENMRLKKVKE